MMTQWEKSLDTSIIIHLATSSFGRAFLGYKSKPYINKKMLLFLCLSSFSFFLSFHAVGACQSFSCLGIYFFSFAPKASQSRLLCHCEGAFPQGFVVGQSCGSKRLDGSMDTSNQLQISVFILFSSRRVEAIDWNLIFGCLQSKKYE